MLFLDEPTTGLDPMSRITLWEEVRRLNGEGTTVLLTTQYLEEADQLADRVAIIDHGKIVKQGTPTALKAAVGAPTLLISVPATQALDCRDTLARFGELRTTTEGSLGVGLEGGAGAVTDVVRALDEAGIKVQHLELNEPSLDDVFAESTGYRLEGASAAMTDAGGPAPKPRRTSEGVANDVPSFSRHHLRSRHGACGCHRRSRCPSVPSSPSSVNRPWSSHR